MPYLATWTFTTALVLATAAAPRVTNDWPIVGGIPVPEGQWPEVVALRLGNYLCSGTLIAPRVVLTAAHCFAHVQPGDEVQIYKGTRPDLNDRTAATAVSTTWAPHPDYCGSFDCLDKSYDYGYITLNEPIELAHYPVPIATQADWDARMHKGTPVFLVGFGQTEAGTTGEKHIVETNLADLTPKGLQFFTAGNGKDSCDGDSGGPALVTSADGSQWRLAGVLASGSTDCGKGGRYGTPIGALSWLEAETPYRAPAGACTDLQCLHTEANEEGCTCSVPGKRQALAYLGLLALVYGRRRARV